MVTFNTIHGQYDFEKFFCVIIKKYVWREIPKFQGLKFVYLEEIVQLYFLFCLNKDGNSDFRSIHLYF